MRIKVLFAVFQRNLVSYFSNPTGYVFVCVFVALCSAAAFWSPEFFSNNLANLDQLNQYFPAIMLLFVPAITMSLWAEERKQSTDELLLTLPTTDLDIVLGKYLAAVSIYSISLLFSAFTNFLVLDSLGDPDGGLFVSTYFGYFFVGAAMLSIGMVGSFLTSNVTVAFVMGALLNAPLVLLEHVNTFLSRSDWALSLKVWSIRNNLEELGRGVLSISAVSYFCMITAIMLYLSVILIGRRHWLGGRDGGSMLQHYAARMAALTVVCISFAVLFRHYNWIRIDLTAEGINTLATSTKKILADFDPKHTVEIDAYVSPDVPEAYVQKREALLAMLKEIDNKGGSKVVVNVYDTTPAGEIAERIGKQHNIRARTVSSRTRGTVEERQIYLSAVLRCGLRKVVIPYFELGIPVEYELVRSICTVSEPQRKKIGVVKTSADLMGGRPHLIVEELQKQYDVVSVDPAQPIVGANGQNRDEYAALLAVQPSSLADNDIDNLIDAIGAGIPTAIFEDPLPGFWRNLRRPRPSASIGKLWNFLGVKLVGPPFSPDVVWQDYSPYPKLRDTNHVTNLGVFAHRDAPGAKDSFNVDPITAGMKELLFVFPGAIELVGNRRLDFVKLVQTGNRTGVFNMDHGMMRSFEESQFRRPTNVNYVLAAKISGAAGTDPRTGRKTGAVNVICVADIDVLADDFLHVRANPGEQDPFRFQNIPFVLNVIDSLAGEERFMEIRKREQVYRTLTHLDEALNEIREEKKNKVAEFRKKIEAAEKEAEEGKDRALANARREVDKAREEGDPNKLKSAQARYDIARDIEDEKEDAKVEAARLEIRQNIDRINNEVQREERAIQFKYKILAVVLPPLPPLMFALFFLYRRRLLEQEGVTAERLR